MDTPPYARIVADLRRRIAVGDLRPGEPVPPIRAIAAEWGVAIATATKALATLRIDGDIRTIPRVGSVVAARPRPRRNRSSRPPDADQSETRQHIVRTAVSIADAEGLEALSMRAVAVHTGVATMSLYRYVGNKDDLVLHMIDACFTELDEPVTDPDEPVTDPGDWRGRLETLLRRVWALFRRHTWLSQVVSLTRPQPIPSLLGYVNQVMAALRSTDLDSHTKLYIHMTTYGFAQGLAASLDREMQVAEETGEGEQEWMASHDSQFTALTESGAYADFAAVIRSLDGDYEQDLDELFELGLDTMLTGFKMRYSLPERPLKWRGLKLIACVTSIQ